MSGITQFGHRFPQTASLRGGELGPIDMAVLPSDTEKGHHSYYLLFLM